MLPVRATTRRGRKTIPLVRKTRRGLQPTLRVRIITRHGLRIPHVRKTRRGPQPTHLIRRPALRDRRIILHGQITRDPKALRARRIIRPVRRIILRDQITHDPKALRARKPLPVRKVLPARRTTLPGQRTINGPRTIRRVRKATLGLRFILAT
jgi:hypothetical protein